jgi:hypothetical protein
MKTALDNFEWRSLEDLSHLINHLEMLAVQIQGRDPAWDRKFRDKWGDLEEVYAIMLDRGVKTSDARSRRIVLSAVERLKALTTQSVEC